MRILHLLPGLKVGGQETMIINIANEQVQTEDVIVMIIDDDYEKHLLALFDKKVEIVLIGRPRSSKNPLWLLKLNYEILRRNPYVVHSHYEKLTMYLLKYGYKFVYTIHDTTISAKYLEKNRNVCAISKSVQEDVMKRTSLEPVIIYNGIKIEDINCNHTIKPYNKERPYRIVQVSRLAHEKKGQHILLLALKKMQDEGYHNIYLDFIGDGDSRGFLEELVCRGNISNVRFLGTKSVEYINEHLCEYDLFVQASIFEGFGLTATEAMAAKIPIIVSESEGPLEIINNGRYGLKFINGDVDDCVSKIEELISTDINILQKRVNDAWNYVNKNFNVKNTASNYINYYKTCK